jgi:hypothetical protein
MGAVCGIVGGLMDSADSVAMPAANIKAGANCRILDDLMRILLLNAWTSYYMYTGYDLLKTMKKLLRTALILGPFRSCDEHGGERGEM